MSNAPPPTDRTGLTDAEVRSDLAQADAKLRAVPGLVRQLLANDESLLVSEQVMANVRGMIADLAHQLIGAFLGEAAQRPSDLAAVRGALATQTRLVAHVHAMAVEWRLLHRMQIEAGIDPVRPPLVASLIAGDDARLAALARDVLTSQARFCRTQQRMGISLDDLPRDILRAAVAAAHEIVVEAHGATAGRHLSAARDDSGTRSGQLRQLIRGMGSDVADALSITEAGASLFLSALAMASGQERDLMVLSTDPTQMDRLALCLRAGGVGSSAASEQILALHPTATPPQAILQIESTTAATILAGSGAVGGQVG